MSVKTRLTQATAVSGRVQRVSRREPPLRVLCSMMTQTALAPTARSMAPPTSGPLPARRMSQLARSPFSATSNAPRIVTSMWPPRIMAKEAALSTMVAPRLSVIRRLPASTRSESAASGAARGPTPMTPFSDWKVTARPAGR